MKILGEKIEQPGKKTASFLFIFLFSTFLLLFLYHHDCWSPIRYWLFLNGLILFIIPLLTLNFFYNKKTVLTVFTGVLLLIILIFLVKVSTTRHLFIQIKRPQAVYPLSAIVFAVTILLLFLGKVNLRSYGIAFGKVRFWFPIFIFFFVCMLPLLLWASRMPSFQKTYPVLPLARKGVQGFIIAELSFGIFFVFWEFFFRGYMLFALEKRTGFLIANGIQAMAFTFMHFGKPELEVYSALAGGLIIGWLCLRSKSFLPAFFIHWAIQTTMDLFAVLK